MDYGVYGLNGEAGIFAHLYSLFYLLFKVNVSDVLEFTTQNLILEQCRRVIPCWLRSDVQRKRNCWLTHSLPCASCDIYRDDITLRSGIKVFIRETEHPIGVVYPVCFETDCLLLDCLLLLLLREHGLTIGSDWMDQNCELNQKLWKQPSSL